MSDANPFVVDVTSASFDPDVLERSHEVPVLVDFWASWCGPCRMLGPVLEALAAELGGRFILAKVDTEANPELGSRFAVRSIPAAKLFVGGKVVGEFVGALPGSQVRRFLETHIPNEAASLVASARTLLLEGDAATAREKLREAVELDDKQTAAHLMLARLALIDEDAAIVEHHVSSIPMAADEHEVAQHVRDAMALVKTGRDAGGEADVDARVAAQPDDLEARFASACCALGGQRYEDALEGFLEVVKRNAKWNDGAARKAMLTIFGLLEPQHPMRKAYVRQLQIYT